MPFTRNELRDAMATELKIARATLYAYAVMPHHVHLLVRPHPKMNGPKLMQMFKKNTGQAIMKLLSETEQRQFDQQRGLNGNTFWKYSFRSIVIDREGMLSQKVNYIHQNPVKAGLRGTG
jgi:putative transposase